MSLTSELLELSQHLQQEHLFVSTEREQLQRLYQNVTVLSEKLAHTSWIGRQQKLNLQHFINQGTSAGETVEVYGANNQLEETNFVDSYKVFSYHDTKYGELLKFLYENPGLLAILICEAEKVEGLNIPRMINMTVTSVYGNCIFQEDEQAVLQLLKKLLDIKVANSDNPRKLIRRQNLSFSLVYKHLCESLFSARLFLTAALYEPTMKLLTEDEWFFDIDPDKAVVRFPTAEKQKRFGEPGTEQYEQKHAQYRAYIVDKLVALALRFINSIKANIHCFPASLGWLVSQVYRVLTERGKVDMQEVRASCADLVFALFICPAICDPEPHGITSDVPISHIARHNLMQMAQIIQVLAISQWEEISPKFRDLYGRFEKGCMSSVLDLFLEGPWDDISEQVGAVNQNKQASRSAVLLTAADVREMIGFLRNTTVQIDDKTPHKKTLEQLLSALPADMPPSASDSSSLPGGGGVITPSTAGTSGSFIYSPDSPTTPTTERKLLKNKGHKKKRSATNAPQLEEVIAESSEAESKQSSDVLVISIYPPGECPGMLPEKTVLSSVQETETKKVPSHTIPSSSPVAISTPQVAPNPEIQEKRTRFSLSHDQESIGNASDYQEVISEAASSHSVEDENELETDNFSDMMSANVSGRGSPSISGRDTPLSQAGSVEENPPAAQLPVPVPETVRKENRVDVTERFGKFEIKAELAMERDECKSTVSDTWSTDVLASDSEPPEQNQVDRLEEVAEEIARPLLLGSEPISEISETASDAWSTDVLASDTEEKHSELLKDLEQDLISGVLDRDEGDNSLGQDEVDENDVDQLGAIGGGGTTPQQTIEASDTFPDVFGELSNKQGDDADKTGNGKKVSTIVHHFQSGPNLQPPSIHRLPSQSLKHAEGRVTSVVGTIETPSPGGPAVTSTGAVVHPSTGARSKVRDKKRNREGRGSVGSTGAGGDDGLSNEFDHSTSGSGGRKRSKDRWPWNRGHKGSSRNENTNPAPGMDDRSLSQDSSSSTGGAALPAPPTAGRGGRTSSRDSGIDIWVNTNGQMSGSSSRSPAAALINARSSLDSISPRPTVPLPGRSSLDSNLQRLHSIGGAGMPSMTSTPDSGIHSYMSSTVSSSLDTSTPPLEMDNPLYQLQSTDSSATEGTNPFSGLSSLKDRPASGNNEDSLLLMDQDIGGDTSTSEQIDNQAERKSGPQIEVTGTFKNISAMDGNGQESVDPETTNVAEQQISNINERRLSSALTLFDPFSPEADETPTNLLTVEVRAPAGEITKDQTISFNDSVKFIDDDNVVSEMSFDSAFPTKANGTAVMVEEVKKAEQEPERQKGHHRQDSSGSSHSASSLKLVTTAETSSKQGGDNISLLSDDRDLADSDRQKKGSSVSFLRTMKDKLHKGIKRKNTKFEKDMGDVFDNDSTGTLKASTQTSVIKETPALPNPESTDDILAKYRTPKKPGPGKTGTSNGSIMTNNNTSTVNNNTSKEDASDSTTAAQGSSGASAGLSRNSRGGSISDTQQLQDDGEPPFFDLENLEGCAAFKDAKRKLRLVLSMADVNYGLSQIQSSSPREGISSRKNEIITILTAQLAEALNLQNKDLVAQLYEVIRCMKMFDSEGCRKLIRSMRDDYRGRSAYVSYLVRCRQGLLSTRNQLQKLLSRVSRDREICSKHITTVCARNFLERRERKMWKFISEFQKLSMSDEKIEFIEQFLQQLYQEMSTDILWKAATDRQVEEGQQAIERLLMSRIYTHALFPNGDGDLMRDQVLQEHLQKLSKVISPLHKDLRIPRMYHLECPWPAAQKEIFMMNAYRTPKDKIQCVLRCAKTIMNLLSMANEKSVPAADDFMPVLIYVLIKANPFGLLSTIQYVNSFYENRLHGEEQYWWLQLTSAVEFIKTMEYST